MFGFIFIVSKNYNSGNIKLLSGIPNYKTVLDNKEFVKKPQDFDGLKQLQDNVLQKETNIPLESLKAYSLTRLPKVAFTGIINQSLDTDDNTLKITFSDDDNKSKKSAVEWYTKFDTMVDRSGSDLGAKCPQEYKGGLIDVSREDTGKPFEIEIPVTEPIVNLTATRLKYKIRYPDIGKEEVYREVNPSELYEKEQPLNTCVSAGKAQGKLIDTLYDAQRLSAKGDNAPVIIGGGNLLDLRDGKTIPSNVKGILIESTKEYLVRYLDELSHETTRLRHRKIPCAIISSEESKRLEQLEGKPVELEVSPTRYECRKIEGLKKPEPTTPITIAPLKPINRPLKVDDPEFKPETVGTKAYNLKRLADIQGKKFTVPKFFVVPSGIFKETIEGGEDPRIKWINRRSRRADKSQNLDIISKRLSQIREICSGLEIPENLKKQIIETKKSENMQKYLMVRSSYNGEDTKEYSTEGLYDSVGVNNHDDLMSAIRYVWASKWNEPAYWSRRDNKIPHDAIQPNVIVQEVAPVDYQFTIDTADSLTHDKNKITIQLTQGVYSGFPGKPYVFEYNTETGEVKRTCMANKNKKKALRNIDFSDTVKNSYDDKINLDYCYTDYSQDPLNRDKSQYSDIIKKIGNIARYIEKQMKDGPQQIEGGVKFDEQQNGSFDSNIYIWQTRKLAG